MQVSKWFSSAYMQRDLFDFFNLQKFLSSSYLEVRSTIYSNSCEILVKYRMFTPNRAYFYPFYEI